jgi:hypothetical protein
MTIHIWGHGADGQLGLLADKSNTSKERGQEGGVDDEVGLGEHDER